MTDDLSMPVGEVETARSAEVSTSAAPRSPAAGGRDREAARPGTTVVRRRTVRRMVAPDADGTATGRPPMHWNRMDAIVAFAFLLGGYLVTWQMWLDPNGKTTAANGTDQ